MSWSVRRAMGIVSLVVIMSAVNGWAASKCHVCGLDLSDFANTRYTIITKKQGTLEACSFYCVTKVIHEIKKRKIKRLRVVDYNTGDQLDAKRAIYVIGSAVKEQIHKKSWLAFGDKNSARVFILRNGGMSRQFHKAEKTMSTILSNTDRIPKLLKNQQTPGCLKCHGDNPSHTSSH